MSDQLEQDQRDFFGRLSSLPYFADVQLLLEEKGLTEADIEQALSVLGEKAGKIGACSVVLMPTLTNDAPDAPGPRSIVRMTVQVIDQPLFNLGDTGTGKSASQIAEQIRKNLHHFSTGRGNAYSFAAQDPIPVDVGKNSYGVAFTRLCTDTPPPKVAAVAIELSSPVAPSTVTLSTVTAGAAIYYTIDGSYPGSGNAAAVLYDAPFEVTTAGTIRAAAELADYQPSNITCKIITA